MTQNGPKKEKIENKKTKIESPAEDWKDGKTIFDIVYFYWENAFFQRKSEEKLAYMENLL